MSILYYVLRCHGNNISFVSGKINLYFVVMEKLHVFMSFRRHDSMCLFRCLRNATIPLCLCHRQNAMFVLLSQNFYHVLVYHLNLMNGYDNVIIIVVLSKCKNNCVVS